MHRLLYLHVARLESSFRILLFGARQKHRAEVARVLQARTNEVIHAHVIYMYMVYLYLHRVNPT